MFLLWLCHVSPLAELHPCIHNQRTPNFAVYNHTYIYMYRYIYISLYMRVCVLQGHGEADRRLSPGVGGRGRSPLISIIHYILLPINIGPDKKIYLMLSQSLRINPTTSH